MFDKLLRLRIKTIHIYIQLILNRHKMDQNYLIFIIGSTPSHQIYKFTRKIHMKTIELYIFTI
jgi:hypothetical protein